MIIIIPLVIVAGVLAWLLRPKAGTTRPVKIAIWTTLIPPAAITIAAVISQSVYNAIGMQSVSDISDILLMVGLGLIAAAILTAAVFTFRRRWDITKGISFSVCIAAILYIIGIGIIGWISGV